MPCKDNINVSSLAQLPVYLAFKKLSFWLFAVINRMPRWIKNSEGVQCITAVHNCVKCLSLVARTYDMKEKVRYIDSFFLQFDSVEFSIDFFIENHALSAHQSAVCISMMRGIEEQLKRLRGWSYTQSRQNQKDGGDVL